MLEAVDLFATQAQAIMKSPAPPDVIICALPYDLINRVVHDTVISDDGNDDDDEEEDTSGFDFHDLLKARTIHLKRP